VYIHPCFSCLASVAVFPKKVGFFCLQILSSSLRYHYNGGRQEKITRRRHRYTEMTKRLTSKLLLDIKDRVYCVLDSNPVILVYSDSKSRAIKMNAHGGTNEQRSQEHD